MRLVPVAHHRVKLNDSFWQPRLETNRCVTLPLQYQKVRESGSLGAHEWDWWEGTPESQPWQIRVGDLGKLIEGMAYSLACAPDPVLTRQMEEAVACVIAGQKEDGYLHPNPMRRDQVFQNLQECHEHYSIGHEIEGAVAHFNTTGRTEFLDAMCRAADLLCATFGWEPGRSRGYDGHPEVELALVKLYRATGRERYLDLAKFFVDARGTEPSYFAEEARKLEQSGGRFRRCIPAPFDYCQAHAPVREQKKAVGHCVRALYLYSGMADVAAEAGDRELFKACKRLWRSVVQRRMYVTGGVGSTALGESFTYDYHLPSETAYAETCASIALVFFAHRMLQAEADSQYADVMERALYNGVSSGVSRDGKHFFYVNPLAMDPDRVLKTPAFSADQDPSRAATLERQEWFDCACCPPNIARLFASLGQYLYSTTRTALYVHLYAAGEVECRVGGTGVRLTQQTNYPWDGSVKLSLSVESPASFTLALRIPGWARDARIRVNGRKAGWAMTMRKGYACIKRCWQTGDRVELHLPMPVERITAHPAIRDACGRVTLQRGPLVYCLEQADNGPGLDNLALPATAKPTARHRPRLLGGVTVIEGMARRRQRAGADNALYSQAAASYREAKLVAVPYCLWANRGIGEMIVWIREA